MAIPTQSSITQQENLTSQQISSPELPKRARRITTQEEKDILSRLFVPGEQLTEAKIANVLLELEKISSDWNDERVKLYYNNNKRKKL